jgi:hypothetical protein
VYYNRTQSETLRERNRIQLVLGFNKWELPGEQVGVVWWVGGWVHWLGELECAC